jgi:hypothetical protein
MGRLTKEPDDIHIFGRAIALRHAPKRDNASEEDVRRRSWMAKWPRLLRVHHPEFVAGTMRNGVSLYELMEELQTQAFAATQRNAERGSGNTNPRMAYRQQPAVELTSHGAAWLQRRFEQALLRHGRLPLAQLDELD